MRKQVALKIKAQISSQKPIIKTEYTPKEIRRHGITIRIIFILLLSLYFLLSAFVRHQDPSRFSSSITITALGFVCAFAMLIYDKRRTKRARNKRLINRKPLKRSVKQSTHSPSNSGITLEQMHDPVLSPISMQPFQFGNPQEPKGPCFDADVCLACGSELKRDSSVCPKCHWSYDQ
jgi:hypothetical protein